MNYFTRKLRLVVLAAATFAFGVSAVEVGVPVGLGENMTFNTTLGTEHGKGLRGSESELGIRLHLSNSFALQPSISVFVSDKDENVGVNLDALFYVSESNSVRQYLGANIGIDLNDDKNNFRLGGIYGLQHELTKALDIFAQMGFSMRFDDVRFYTVNTQAGLIFYVLK